MAFKRVISDAMRGSGARYIPPKCETMRTHGLCPSRTRLAGAIIALSVCV